MSTSGIHIRLLGHPKISLVLFSVAWKLLLLCIAIASPGLGYDTSTMLLQSESDYSKSVSISGLHLPLRLEKLARWDAIYFTLIAQRGYTWEQEWAFGYGFTTLMALMSKGLAFCGYSRPIETEALAGMITSHAFHILSVLMLHELTLAVYPSLSKHKLSGLAFVAACLHILSPAGIFLSAPYAESSFSFLNIAGCFSYAKALKAHEQTQTMKRDGLLIVSGILFGIATTFRGNGLFSGLILIYDACSSMSNIIQFNNVNVNIRRVLIVGLSGVLMACIAMLPQYLAYSRFCIGSSAETPLRPWCSKWVPSIYAWVQKEYWGVGFLRYWTLSNFPLFVLAAPMLYILLYSGYWASNDKGLVRFARPEQKVRSPSKPLSRTSTARPDMYIYTAVARPLAIPQVILAILALTSYHVQIITRLSSGYPVWYWWLASLAMADRRISICGRNFRSTSVIARWMVLYAIVQGGLFASFLPPA